MTTYAPGWTYAIGDIQGCFSALELLLEQIRFDPARDRLWFVGDLVNRGPESARVLRFVKGLGPTAVTVLGNHDLHLLAVAEGCTRPRRDDTFQEILAAPDREELLVWLRHQRLIYRRNGFVLVHAGLLPQWTVSCAEGLAQEVEAALRSAEHRAFLSFLYQKRRPRKWSDDLAGMERLVTIATTLTRLRICSASGQLDFSFTGPPGQAPKGFLPWFEIPGRASAEATIICGHWAALGLVVRHNLVALDGGCVWGRRLVAVRLEDRHVFQVACTNQTEERALPEARERQALPH